MLDALEASVYLSGVGEGSRRYIQESNFEGSPMKLVWQEFDHPIYPQLHGPFLKGLSILDMFFNCGVAQTATALKGEFL